MAALLHRLDRRIHDEPSAVLCAGAPVLASIPRGRRPRPLPLLAAIRRSRPYHDLSREEFEQVADNGKQPIIKRRNRYQQDTKPGR